MASMEIGNNLINSETSILNLSKRLEKFKGWVTHLSSVAQEKELVHAIAPVRSRTTAAETLLNQLKDLEEKLEQARNELSFAKTGAEKEDDDEHSQYNYANWDLKEKRADLESTLRKRHWFWTEFHQLTRCKIRIDSTSYKEPKRRYFEQAARLKALRMKRTQCRKNESEKRLRHFAQEQQHRKNTDCLLNFGFLLFSADRAKELLRGPPLPPFKDDDSRVRYQHLESLSKPRYTLVAGSTSASENQLIIDVFQRTRQIRPDLNPLLILAPGSGNLDEIIEISRAAGLRAIAWHSNEWDKHSSAPKTLMNRFIRKFQHYVPPPIDVVVINSYGHLHQLYALGQCCILGGCLNELLEHNPLEPLVHGKPVHIGKNYGLGLEDESQQWQRHEFNKYFLGSLPSEVKLIDPSNLSHWANQLLAYADEDDPVRNQILRQQELIDLAEEVKHNVFKAIWALGEDAIDYLEIIGEGGRLEPDSPHYNDLHGANFLASGNGWSPRLTKEYRVWLMGEK